MRRGQITIFIIVGIVLLFILGFAVYMLRLVQVPGVELEPGPTDDRSGCLERVSEHVLLTAASGGANPRIRVGGTTVVPPTQYFFYPLTDAEYQNYRDVVQFGIYKFEPLCLLHGPNRPNASGNGWSSCMSGTYQLWHESDDETLQHYLQQEINRALGDANCSVYGEATVILGTDDVTVSTRNASAVVPMRFKRLHNAAVRIAQADISSIAYDLTRPAQIFTCDEPLLGNICILPEMNVSVQHGDVHIVSVNDSYRRINGVAPVYRFAIENRAPVIFTYPNAGAGGSPPYAPAAAQMLTADYNPQTGRSSPMRIDVVSKDPDDEALRGVCSELHGGNTRVQPFTDSDVIEVACRESGIFITTPACISDAYVWGAANIFYEGCDGSGTCANTTVATPGFELGDDSRTAEYCCTADPATLSRISEVRDPASDYCCDHRLFGAMSDGEKDVCCGRGSLSDSYENQCCGYDDGFSYC